MQLVQFGFGAEFEKSTQIYTPARKVFTALGGEIDIQQPREPGAWSTNQKEKMEVHWDYDHCTISFEKIEKHSALIDSTLHLLETINSVARLGNLENVRLGTKWILPAPKHDFISLNKLYMQKLLSEKKFMHGTYDSGIVLDINIDDLVIHHQSGPMIPEQLLSQFLIFKRANLPKLFIFLYTTIVSTKTVQYSTKEISNLLKDFLYKCEFHGDSFGKIWEGNL